MKIWKLLPTLCIKGLVKTVFFLCSLCLPIQRQKIVFASNRTNDIEGNLLYIYEDLKSQHPEYTYVLLFQQTQHSIKGKINMLKQMLLATYHLSTASYFVVDDYYFPIYVITPRPETEIVQVWHGAGAFKKFGHSTVGKSFGSSEQYLKHVKVHSNYTKVIVSTEKVIPFFAEAFQISPNHILPLGLPRTDFLFNEEKLAATKERLYEVYPQLKGRKLILFAPTYRGSGYVLKEELNLDFNQLQAILGPEYAIIVKYHPYVHDQLEIKASLKDFVFNLDEHFATEEILVVSDILVTDYSSIIFDYSLLGRPMAFFATDLEAYISERDFYYDYEDFVPGPIFKNTVDLAIWIKQEQFNLEPIVEFRNYFFDHLDGQASKRVINAIFTEKDR